MTRESTVAMPFAYVALSLTTTRIKNFADR